MQWCAFWILCIFLSGCGDSGNMNSKAYVITQTQVDEMELDPPMPSLEK